MWSMIPLLPLYVPLQYASTAAEGYALSINDNEMECQMQPWEFFRKRLTIFQPFLQPHLEMQFMRSLHIAFIMCATTPIIPFQVDGRSPLPKEQREFSGCRNISSPCSRYRDALGTPLPSSLLPPPLPETFIQVQFSAWLFTLLNHCCSRSSSSSSSQC